MTSPVQLRIARSASPAFLPAISECVSQLSSSSSLSSPRIANLYFSPHCCCTPVLWRQFLNKLLSQPWASSLELVLATETLAGPLFREQTRVEYKDKMVKKDKKVKKVENVKEDKKGEEDKKREDKNLEKDRNLAEDKKDNATLSLLTLPPGIRILPLFLPIESACFHSSGVLTLPSVLHTHFSSLKQQKNIALCHLDQVLESERVLPGLRRFLPQKDLIGGAGVGQTYLWQRNNEGFPVFGKAMQKGVKKGGEKKSVPKQKVLFHVTEQSQRAALSGFVLLSSQVVRYSEDCSKNIKMLEPSSHSLADLEKHNLTREVTPSWEASRPLSQIITGMETAGSPLVVTGVTNRIIHSLNDMDPLSAIMQTTAQYPSLGQSLLFGKISPLLPSSPQRKGEKRTDSSFPSSYPSNFSSSYSSRFPPSLPPEFYPISARVTSQGLLELIQPVQPLDQLVILHVGASIQEDHLSSLYPKHKSKFRSPGKDKMSFPIWAFSSESQMSTPQRTIWEHWRDRGASVCGGHFRQQIYAGREFQESVSWGELFRLV